LENWNYATGDSEFSLPGAVEYDAKYTISVIAVSKIVCFLQQPILRVAFVLRWKFVAVAGRRCSAAQ
jgi:hypothetical protein